MRTRMRTRWIGCLLAVVLAGCDMAGPAAVDAPVGPAQAFLGGALLRSAIEGSLRDTEMHLNNYGDEGEERAHSWYRGNDSYLRLGAGLGGGEIRFDIPESRSTAGPFRLLYYVNDLNVLADSIAVVAEADSVDLLLAVRFPFEEGGTEFKGHCRSQVLGQTRSCLGSTDRIAPDIQLDGARIVVVLRPVVHQGGLSFAAVRVAFEGAVQAGGVCDIDLGVVAFDVCNAVTGYRGDIQDEMETLVLEGFNDPAVRDRVAAGLRPVLDALGIGAVTALGRDGDDLLLTYLPPTGP